MSRIASENRGAGLADRWRVVLRRLFWASMLLLHVVALPSLFDAVATDTTGAYLTLVTRITGLTLSAAFFVLKIFDVPWLRMRGGWRGAVAAVLILGLLHVGVLDRAIEGEVGLDPMHMPWLFASVVLGSALLLKQLHAALMRRLPVDGTLTNLQLDRRARSHDDAWSPFTSLVPPLCTAPRAPPIA